MSGTQFPGQTRLSPERLFAEAVLVQPRRRAEDGLGGEERNPEARHRLCYRRSPVAPRLAGHSALAGQASRGLAPLHPASPVHSHADFVSPPPRWKRTKLLLCIKLPNLKGGEETRGEGPAVQLRITEREVFKSRNIVANTDDISNHFISLGAGEAELPAKAASPEEANRPFPPNTFAWVFLRTLTKPSSSSQCPARTPARGLEREMP